MERKGEMPKMVKKISEKTKIIVPQTATMLAGFEAIVITCGNYDSFQVNIKLTYIIHFTHFSIPLTFARQLTSLYLLEVIRFSFWCGRRGETSS